MSNGPIPKTINTLVNEAMQSLRDAKVEEAQRAKMAMLNGLAKAYLEETKHPVEEVVLVEEIKNGILCFRFAHTSEFPK